MKILVLGGGGREHALCWALAIGGHELVCAPGNAGVDALARCVVLDPTDTAAVRELAVREAVDLVVVGPEAPLVAGVVDSLHVAGVPTFGPTSAAARIEGSKAFCKDVMATAGVPTAGYWSGTDVSDALVALERFAPPYVVKADGLAAGKGVRICADRAEAEHAVRAAMVERVFGDAGERVVIEEFLDGPECSLFALCDGRTALCLEPAQDFKRAADGDAGPNTGGMGAFCPVPGVDAAAIARSVVDPMMAELDRRGLPYVGVLYAGLVLTDGGPKVLEFNVRFGDPETQVVLPRLNSELGRLLYACATGALPTYGPLDWDARACVTVVLASGGYPGAYATGLPISGLAEAAAVPDALVFHAGTRLEDDAVVTAGGRVLAVSGLGATVADARRVAYAAADRIAFDGVHRRSDIAAGR